MKYILVIPDGGADESIAEYDGRTAFEIAATPTFDRMAREGKLGLAATIPTGLQPGSDVANLSLLGYDPHRLTGRAALEAAATGVEIPDGDAMFRANLVTVDDNQIMLDYSAGHISTEEGRELIERLSRDLTVDGVILFPGVGYRHLCLMEAAGTSVPQCTPPHEIVGEVTSEHLPQGQYSSWVLEVERSSAERMPEYEVNKKRVADGKNPATQLWLWGGATRMTLEPFTAKYGIGSAGLISAVDLMKGIGKLSGMDVIEVEGATAYLDTNFAGKGRAALDYIYTHDLIIVHVEAPDEAGHNGDIKAKVKALEDIDRHIMAPLYAMARYYGDWRIMVAPDHPTPVGTGKHSAEPVPYVLWGPGFEGNGAKLFNEKEAARVGGDVVEATGLLYELIGCEAAAPAEAPESPAAEAPVETPTEDPAEQPEEDAVEEPVVDDDPEIPEGFVELSPTAATTEEPVTTLEVGDTAETSSETREALEAMYAALDDSTAPVAAAEDEPTVEEALEDLLDEVAEDTAAAADPNPGVLEVAEVQDLTTPEPAAESTLPVLEVEDVAEAAEDGDDK